MGEIKQRDYVFDTLRGLCMWSIPISHFTRMAGHFSHDSLSGIVYITINVFVMQAFMFLSGYFSKKPEKSRTIAFKTFLWPYILSIFFFYGIRTLLWGHATLYLDRPPFAMWFMLALFLYKVFQKNYVKIPHFFAITFVLYLFAGCIPFLTEFLSLGRIVSYFPFFFLGYYCTPEHISKIKCLKRWQCWLLGIVLTGISVYLAFGLKEIPVEWYLLRRPGAEIGVMWYTDVLMRLLLVVLGCAWIVLMFNVLPGKDNYLAYVGRNTMPVYIFHLVVRQWIKKHGITMGLFMLPEADSVLYYVLIFGLASLCVVVFSSKPVSRFYDFVVDGLYSVFMWMMNHIVLGFFCAVEKTLVGCGLGIVRLLERQKQ
ncbi:acyltransferase family protein [Ihubacter sp. mB4P-1]|uniref:acyltransferase family protein n=1 Tax=Ihubacter sp. mB4P-1 TaxID=3242370 RepID=UPI003C7B6910